MYIYVYIYFFNDCYVNFVMLSGLCILYMYMYAGMNICFKSH